MTFSVIDGVFQYPSASSPILDRINLQVEEGELLAILGPNGAGKTTLVAALLKSRGIEAVTSPTFNLRNDYTAANTRAVHIDFYRLKEADSAFDLLPPDEDYSDAMVFVEWPEKAPPQLFAPFDRRVKVTIEHIHEGGRRITWQQN